MPEYFTLDEFSELPTMSQGKFNDEEIESAAAYVVAVIEREVGTSFVARTKTAVLVDGNGLGTLMLPDPYVLSLTSVSSDSISESLSNLALVDGFIRRKDGSRWPSGVLNVSVTYQAGWSTVPPADIKEAAMVATRARLLERKGNARTNDRASSITNDAGGTTTFVLAGPDRPFGYPDVDAVVIGWRDKIRVPNVA